MGAFNSSPSGGTGVHEQGSHQDSGTALSILIPEKSRWEDEQISKVEGEVGVGDQGEQDAQHVQDPYPTTSKLYETGTQVALWMKGRGMDLKHLLENAPNLFGSRVCGRLMIKIYGQMVLWFVLCGWLIQGVSGQEIREPMKTYVISSDESLALTPQIATPPDGSRFSVILKQIGPHIGNHIYDKAYVKTNHSCHFVVGESESQCDAVSILHNENETYLALNGSLMPSGEGYVVCILQEVPVNDVLFCGLVFITPTCPALSMPTFVMKSGCNEDPSGQVKPGNTCHFSCPDGYIGRGDVNRTCLADGTWSNTSFTCEAPTCPALSMPTFVMKSGCNEDPSGQVKPGTTCHFSCPDGYIGRGDVNRTCLADGTWSNASFTCEAVTCPSDNVAKPFLEGCDPDSAGGIATGTICSFPCDGCIDDARMVCLHNGTWLDISTNSPDIPHDDCELWSSIIVPILSVALAICLIVCLIVCLIDCPIICWKIKKNQRETARNQPHHNGTANERMITTSV